MTDASGTISPIVVGDRVAKVLWTPSKKKGHEYPGFTADLRPFGLKNVWGSTPAILEEKVRAALAPLTGEADKLTLERGALREHERAKRIAAELGLELDGALQRLRSVEQLAATKGCTVEQAVEYWARHHDQSKFNTPVTKVVDAFLGACTENGNTKEDISTMKGKLKKFGSAFCCPLSEIPAEQYCAYFRTIAGSARNKRNHRSTVRRLVNWAKDNGYLALDHPGLPRFAGRVKVAPKRVEVFDLRQREELIKQARLIERPMTLIKAYVPIRAKEAGISCWENIDWDVGIIMVCGDEAKKREPRSIRLPRELCERLRPLARPAGRIYPYKSFYKVGPRLARKARLKWIKNGWRTTTISHLQAAVNDMPRVAEEAGTSVNKLKSNYLKPLRPDVGRAYFGLKKGERHPIEPGYNAERYGSDIPAEPTEEAGNVIAIRFGGQA